MVKEGGGRHKDKKRWRRRRKKRETLQGTSKMRGGDLSDDRE